MEFADLAFGERHRRNAGELEVLVERAACAFWISCWMPGRSVMLDPEIAASL